MNYDLSVVQCDDYSAEKVRAALDSVLAPVGGLDWVTPGMKIAVKVNLVTFLKPEAAGTTHPALVCELCRMLAARGAKVVVGDSPGGPWSSAVVGKVYAATGMRAVEEAGATLNRDFSQCEADFPEGKLLKSFQYTSYLKNADFIINFCKLKTHGLTSMSCAVKNLFGVIPGTRKPEMHYFYPRISDFADILIDINEYVRPRLIIVDAVTAMQGNGPTQGTPRHVGALLASTDPYRLDLACSKLIGLDPNEVPTIRAAIARGLSPDTPDALSICGPLDSLIVDDFEKMPPNGTSRFDSQPRLIREFLSRTFGSFPHIAPDDCAGCGECARVCPRNTISLDNGKAVIHRKECIRCFCCQEFCPKGAIVVGRTRLARLLSK